MTFRILPFILLFMCVSNAIAFSSLRMKQNAHVDSNSQSRPFRYKDMKRNSRISTKMPSTTTEKIEEEGFFSSLGHSISNAWHKVVDTIVPEANTESPNTTHSSYVTTAHFRATGDLVIAAEPDVNQPVVIPIATNKNRYPKFTSIENHPYSSKSRSSEVWNPSANLYHQQNIEYQPVHKWGSSNFQPDVLDLKRSDAQTNQKIESIQNHHESRPMSVHEHNRPEKSWIRSRHISFRMVQENQHPKKREESLLHQGSPIATKEKGLAFRWKVLKRHQPSENREMDFDPGCFENPVRHKRTIDIINALRNEKDEELFYHSPNHRIANQPESSKKTRFKKSRGCVKKRVSNRSSNSHEELKKVNDEGKASNKSDDIHSREASENYKNVESDVENNKTQIFISKNEQGESENFVNDNSKVQKSETMGDNGESRKMEKILNQSKKLYKQIGSPSTNVEFIPDAAKLNLNEDSNPHDSKTIRSNKKKESGSEKEFIDTNLEDQIQGDSVSKKVQEVNENEDENIRPRCRKKSSSYTAKKDKTIENNDYSLERFVKKIADTVNRKSIPDDELSLLGESNQVNHQDKETEVADAQPKRQAFYDKTGIVALPNENTLVNGMEEYQNYIHPSKTKSKNGNQIDVNVQLDTKKNHARVPTANDVVGHAVETADRDRTVEHQADANEKPPPTATESNTKSTVTDVQQVQVTANERPPSTAESNTKSTVTDVQQVQVTANDRLSNTVELNSITASTHEEKDVQIPSEGQTQSNSREQSNPSANIKVSVNGKVLADTHKSHYQGVETSNPEQKYNENTDLEVLNKLNNLKHEMELEIVTRVLEQLSRKSDIAKEPVILPQTNKELVTEYGNLRNEQMHPEHVANVQGTKLDSVQTLEPSVQLTRTIPKSKSVRGLTAKHTIVASGN